MRQKYKVFSDKSVIEFSESSKNKFVFSKFDKITNFKAFHEVTSSGEFILESNDPENDLMRLFLDFKLIHAAGGIVTSGQSLLLIHRLGLWDLPKGKIEPGESVEDAAYREVKEECGISDGLKVISQFKKTYHVYEHLGVSILKKTYWFHMSLPKSVNISPQLEEDIRECRWISIHNIGSYLEQSYPLIKDLVLDFYQDK